MRTKKVLQSSTKTINVEVGLYLEAIILSRRGKCHTVLAHVFWGQFLVEASAPFQNMLAVGDGRAIKCIGIYLAGDDA